MKKQKNAESSRKRRSGHESKSDADGDIEVFRDQMDAVSECFRKIPNASVNPDCIYDFEDLPFHEHAELMDRCDALGFDFLGIGRSRIVFEIGDEQSPFEQDVVAKISHEYPEKGSSHRSGIRQNRRELERWLESGGEMREILFPIVNWDDRTSPSWIVMEQGKRHSTDGEIQLLIREAEAKGYAGSLDEICKGNVMIHEKRAKLCDYG